MGTPISRKTREVQFAAGGRQIAPTFPLIDARFFGTPIHRERPNPSGRPFIGNAQSIVKRGMCNFSAGGREIAPTFPLIDARFFGTPIQWGRPYIVKRGPFEPIKTL